MDAITAEDLILANGKDTFTRSFLDAIAEHPEEAWRTAGRKTKANPNGEDIDWWLTNGQQMVEAYYHWRKINPNLVIWETPQGVPAIELQVNVNLEDGTMLRGFIDRVFQDFDSGELLVVDLKSGNNTPPPIQLATYRLALEQTFGYSPKYGSYWMARKGTLDTVHDLDKYPPAMVSRWLRDMKKIVDMDIYIPHVTTMCGYCGVREHCYTQNEAAYKPNFVSDINMTVEGN